LENLSEVKLAELERWRENMVHHLSERGEAFVKDGKLVLRENTLLYSPNFPEDSRNEAELVKDWRDSYKGL
jgi:hypothetical protein